MSDTSLPPAAHHLEEPALHSASAPAAPRPIVVATLLLLLVFLAFAPAIFGGYTWDDDAWLTQNPMILYKGGIPAMWDLNNQPDPYSPLIYMTFWVAYRIWGLNPLGYHILNILLHGFGAILLWRIFLRLTPRIAILAAILWAIHPTQVDSVAWVAELKNILSGIFYFISILLFLQFTGIGASKSATESPALSRANKLLARSIFIYGFSFLSFVCAIISKNVTCTLPAALVLILLWKRPPNLRRHLLATVPFFLFTAVAALYSIHMESQIVHLTLTDINISFPQRCLIACLNCWHYWGTLLFPYPLMPIPPRWDILHPSWLELVSIPLLLALPVLLWLFRRRLTLTPLFALAYFIATLFPALGFLNFATIRHSFVAPHFQYLACIAPLALAAEVLRRLLSKKPLPIRIALLSLILAPYVALTFFYSYIYQSDMRMWQWNVAHNPNAWNAHHDLAVAYLGVNNVAAAETEMRAALALRERDGASHLTMAAILVAEKRYNDALPEFRRALELEPGDPRTYLALGNMYEETRQFDAAANAYARAAAIHPRAAWIRFAYAHALAQAGKRAEAKSEYEAVLALNPRDYPARYNYANVLLDLGEAAAAIQQYRTLLADQPDNADAWYNLAVAYHQSGDDTQALTAQSRAKQIEATRPPSTTTP